MMRSLFSGVAGLKTHQTRMDVIGNNIANVNTVAFKASSMTFQDLMYQTTQGASGANAATGMGGTNATQIGLGVKAGAISTNMTGGSSQSTGDPFDLKINGDGFFIVSNGSEQFYTRAGSFKVDGIGNLVMSSTGYNVLGYAATDDIGTLSQDLTPLKVQAAENKTSDPEATTQGKISGIIDENDEDFGKSSGQSMELQIFDDKGYSYTVKFSFHKVDGSNTHYTLQIDDIVDSNGKSIGAANIDKIAFGEKVQVDDGSGTMVDAKRSFGITADYEKKYVDPDDDPLVLDDDAKLQSFTVTDALGNTKTFPISDASDAAEVEAQKQAAIAYLEEITGEPAKESAAAFKANTFGETYADSNKMESGAMTYSMYQQDLEFAQTGKGELLSVNGGSTTLTLGLQKALTTAGFAFQDIKLDLSALKNVNNKGTSTPEANPGIDGIGKGRRVGKLTSVQIDQYGKIYGNYDNGVSKLLGQIMTANFSNAVGLEKQGENLYSASLNSGDVIIQDISASGGSISTGVLEMSNVDLASEFTEMIITQRGFQANSRIITTSDSMLEELISLKR